MASDLERTVLLPLLESLPYARMELSECGSERAALAPWLTPAVLAAAAVVDADRNVREAVRRRAAAIAAGATGVDSTVASVSASSASAASMNSAVAAVPPSRFFRMLCDTVASVIPAVAAALDKLRIVHDAALASDRIDSQPLESWPQLIAAHLRRAWAEAGITANNAPSEGPSPVALSLATEVRLHQWARMVSREPSVRCVDASVALEDVLPVDHGADIIPRMLELHATRSPNWETAAAASASAAAASNAPDTPDAPDAQAAEAPAAEAPAAVAIVADLADMPLHRCAYTTADGLWLGTEMLLPFTAPARVGWVPSAHAPEDWMGELVVVGEPSARTLRVGAIVKGPPPAHAKWVWLTEYPILCSGDIDSQIVVSRAPALVGAAVAYTVAWGRLRAAFVDPGFGSSVREWLLTAFSEMDPIAKEDAAMPAWRNGWERTLSGSTYPNTAYDVFYHRRGTFVVDGVWRAFEDKAMVAAWGHAACAGALGWTDGGTAVLAHGKALRVAAMPQSLPWAAVRELIPLPRMLCVA